MIRRRDHHRLNILLLLHHTPKIGVHLRPNPNPRKIQLRNRRQRRETKNNGA